MCNKQKNRPIRIWEFDKAPKKYKKLVNPDDCDWLSFIPLEVYKDNFYFPFFNEYQWGDREEWIVTLDGTILVYKHS